jgi:hypothetical protein
MGATPYIPSLAVDTVCEAIAAFIQPFVGVGTPIIRAYDNRTSPPPSDSYDGTNQQIAIAGPKRIDVQINIVGVAAADQCAAIKTVMRTAYAASQFPVGVAPLYCDDGRCNPMITGEQQYDYRWTLTISCQYNPIVTLPQQSANALAISISEALE